MRTYQTRNSIALQRNAKISGAMLMLALVCSWTVMALCGYMYGASIWCLGIKKRDRYAMRPDKVWRSVWLKQMLLPKQYDSFDKYVMFCYKKDTATIMKGSKQ